MSRASTPWRNSIPEPAAAGSIRSAQRRLERVRAERRAPAGDVRLRLGRDDLLGLAYPRRPLDADGRRLAEVGSDAVVALERRLDDLLLDLAVQRDGDLVAVLVLADVDERVLLGELGEGRAERALLLRVCRAKTTASSVGFGKRAVISSPGGGSPIASPTLTAPSPRTVAISPAVTASRRGAPAGANTRIEVGFVSAPPPTGTRWRGAERAGEQADVRDALARTPSARP